MNAEALLKHYERIADGPDAVGRLRKFLLDLALSGRLISGFYQEYPAVRLGSVAQLQNGYAFKSEWFGRTGIRLLRNVNVGHGILNWSEEVRLPVDQAEQFSRFDLRARDIVLSLDRPFIVSGTKVARVQESDLPALLLQRVGRFILQPELSTDYLFLWINSPMFAGQIDPGRSNGVPHISSKQVEAATLLLPPLAEQHRIVTKVDELMALCDRLEAARAEREATRDRLAAASLARLNTPAPDPETFKAHASFAISTALPALTTRPDQIKQLRQTILNLAVRGHLEVSLASDGNASELLNAVEQITGRPAQAAIDSAPFDLPSSWCWSSVGGLSTKTGSGSTPRGGKEVYKPSGVMFLRSQNIYDDGLRLNDVVFIDVETHGRMSGTAVADKDLLLNITGGSIGRCALVQSPAISANISQHVAIVRMAQSEMAPFVHLVIRSPYFQRFVDDEQTGAGRGGLPKNRMDPILVPVPPLAEQHRIVAKVDELMALCNQLEASLTQGANVRSHLIDALLHEALLPLNGKVIDFAAARQRLQEQRESIACRVVQRLGPTRGFGRVRAMKPLYWAEAHCGAALGGQWGRAEAGPFDQWIFNFEAHAASAGWFSVTEHRNGDKVTKAEYRAGTGLSAKAAGAAEALGSAAPEFERVLSLLADLNTEDSEIVTTLYAAWNDLLLEGKPFSDAAVITEVREHWHPSKARFTPALLQTWLDWLRKNRLVPKGKGPNTRHQPELI